MDYCIKEIQTSSDPCSRNAGSKARNDIEAISKANNIQIFEMPLSKNDRSSSSPLKKLLAHKYVADKWIDELSFLKRGDRVIIQLPPIKDHTFLFSLILKKLKKRGVTTILLLHDIELLRWCQVNDVSKARILRTYLEELRSLTACSYVIAHNSKMKKYLTQKKIAKNKIITLNIFDYIIPNYNAERMDKRKIEKDAPIIIAGNLEKKKAGYVYSLPSSQNFNLYGANYNAITSDNVHYFGSFTPDDLPYNLNGSFGLIWDGPSIDTCEGAIGNYLRINNPHKTSLYLASGIPVMIWHEAALASFVERYKCGILIKSLNEIHDKIQSLSDTEYAEMKKNAELIGKKLRNGFFTMNAISKCKH